MKRLVKNESVGYSSEVIVFDGNKFKIEADNGNSYCHVNIYIFTKNGDLGLIASMGDIPNATYVDYIWDDDRRMLGNTNNIIAAEEYIKKVYSI